MKLVCVLVTYNRLDNLKIALQHYENQTNKNFTLVIVDNNSSDGTKEYLKEWRNSLSDYKKEVILLPSNSGGAGGFFAGEKYAMELKPDWVYVSDDDAYPEYQLFEKFTTFISSCNDYYAAVCGTVYKGNGKDIDVNHRSWFRIDKGYKFVIREIPLEYYNKETFETGVFTYVGTFLNGEVLRQVGLCNPNMFIFFDDSDHALRMREKGKLIVVPSMKIVHDTKDGNAFVGKNLFTWRDYYMKRNSFYIQMKYYKRAVPYSSILFILSAIKHYHNNISVLRFLFSACFNGLLGKLGKHPKYSPPFSIKK